MSGTASDPDAVDGQRLFRGISANLFALVVRIIVQLGMLPVLFLFWNDERVGTWLMIWALPPLFGLFAQGFASAGANAALTAEMPVARSVYRDASHSGLAFSLASSLIALLAAVTSHRLGWMGIAIGTDQLILTGGAMMIYVLAGSSMATLEIPLRRTGRYPAVIAFGALTSAAELPALAIGLALNADIAGLSCAMAVTRIAGFVAMRRYAAHAAPAFFDGPRSAGTPAPPVQVAATGFMLLPLVFALNLQGYVLVIGAAFGAASVAAFVATRTLARLFDLLANLMFSAQYYEIGHLADDIGLQRRLLAGSIAFMLLAGLVFAIALMVFGPWVQHVWTSGQTVFDPITALAIVTAALLRGVSTSPSALLAARNAHTRFTLTYLVGSTCALFLAAWFAWSEMPLSAVLSMLVVAEASQTIPCLRDALRRLDYPLLALARDLLHPQRLADGIALFALLTGRNRKATDHV